MALFRKTAFFSRRCFAQTTIVNIQVSGVPHEHRRHLCPCLHRYGHQAAGSRCPGSHGVVNFRCDPLADAKHPGGRKFNRELRIVLAYATRPSHLGVALPGTLHGCAGMSPCAIPSTSRLITPARPAGGSRLSAVKALERENRGQLNRDWSMYLSGAISGNGYAVEIFT